MRPFMENGKILQILFSRRRKDRVFWATMVTHWKILPPQKRKKMLAGAALGLVVFIVLFVLDIHLASWFWKFVSQMFEQ